MKKNVMLNDEDSKFKGCRIYIQMHYSFPYNKLKFYRVETVSRLASGIHLRRAGA